MNAPSPIVRIAPVVFVFLWSTGFIVARYATDGSGPLSFLALRVVCAAIVLAVVAIASASPRPDRAAIGWSMLSGVGMHAVYLGGVFIAIDNGLPSGVGALISGLHPVITAVVGAIVLGETLRRRRWWGVAIGLAGVALVVGERAATGIDGVTAGPVAAAAIGTLGMSLGTLLQRWSGRTTPLMWGTVAQFSGAALVLAPLAVLIEGVDIGTDATTITSMIWSVLVLSVAAVLIMVWLLQRTDAAAVSSLFFLTPALSAIEAAILFGERLAPTSVIGVGVAALGVALATRR